MGPGESNVERGRSGYYHVRAYSRAPLPHQANIMTDLVSEQQLELARASYARCQQVPDFFRRFYNRFHASDPAIPAFFTGTKFEQQDKLLQHGVSLLLIYARQANPELLARIAKRHGPGDLAIPKRLYEPFAASFLSTVQECDSMCDAATIAAWQAALEPGLRFIRDGA